MRKLTVTLRQHTPLIHFQYNQQEATLRVSEVKPRFDKFITSQKGHIDDFEYWKSYLVGDISISEEQLKSMSKEEIDKWKKYEKVCKEKLHEKFNNGFCALDYKMRILPLNNSQKEIIDAKEKALCMYFGNQGDDKDKYGVFYAKDIILEISSYHSELLDILDKNLSLFLEQTNFGTRQTKGYGSFYIKGKSPTHANYSFVVKGTDINTIFTSIADFYSVIRAGINNGGLYIKSALFKYLKQDNRQWDKKTIKEAYYTKAEKNNEITEHENESEEAKEAMLFKIPESGTIYKELLGLSTVELWKPKNGEKHSLTRMHVCTNTDHSIQRFKSPILLKPILESQDKGGYCYRVYVYLSDIPQEMRDQNFKIRWDNVCTLTMNTSSNFKLTEYFKWIYQNKGKIPAPLLGAAPSSKSVSSRYNTIKNIFEQLKQE